MKLTYLATLITASILTVGGTSLVSNSANAFSLNSAESSVIVAANPCASANPCAASSASSDSRFVAVGSGKKAKGTFKVVEEDGKQYIEFSDDFKVSKGPDLEIILHKNSTVKSSISEENYVSLAPIKSFSGAQRYEIPENVDLGEYASVAVWCEDFNVTFGYAKL